MSRFTIKKVTTNPNHNSHDKQMLAPSRPTIDFPAQDEEVSHPHYSIRVGVPAGVRRVEIAINQGSWQPCRPAVGYWWFEWTDMLPGEHEFVVRALEEGGDWLLSDTRQCFAVLSAQ